MAVLDVDGESIFFECHAHDAARNLVLIHGAGVDQRHWPESLATLTTHNVYVLDLPGHGRSGGRGRDSVAAYADVIAAFITRLDLRRVTLAGHSMGSGIALTLALRRPAWLDALVLVGAGARLKVLPALLAQLESDYPAAVDLICQTLFGPAALPAQIAAERQAYLATDWRLLRADFNACNGFDVMERVGEINAPTLIVVGADDMLTPLKYGQFLQDRIPGARLIVIPAAGHLVALEQPAEFQRAIADFLAEL